MLLLPQRGSTYLNIIAATAAACRH